MHVFDPFAASNASSLSSLNYCRHENIKKHAYAYGVHGMELVTFTPLVMSLWGFRT